MTQDHNIFKNRHQQFVKTICETQAIYALKNEEGYATSFSNELVDENEEPVEVFCFWSEKKYAEALINDEWKSFEVETISLIDFLEKWCVGMSNEGLLIGTNFDESLNGFEMDPLELILEVTQALKVADISVTFTKFKDIHDLETQVKDVLEN